MVAVARDGSLPPLRPRSRDEVEAAISAPMYAKRPPRLLLDGGGRDWCQLPPRPAGASRTHELFRALAAPAGPRLRASSQGSAYGSMSPRSRDGEGLSGDGSRTTLTTRTPSRESTSRSRKRRGSHLRAVKAVYLGVVDGAGYPGELGKLQERYRAVDAALAASDKETEEAREARLKMELTDLRTGEDAIKFFTRFGTDSTVDIKILHCNRPPRGSQCGPYDLVVVPSDRVDAEYWTISASGVIHMRPGELSECTPLSEWMQQSLHFRVLKSMSFFRLYPQRKALGQWRTSARYAAYCRARQRLARRCFFAKPMFVGPLMRARRVVSQAAEVQFLHIPEHCCQLADFNSMQSQRLRSAGGGAQLELDGRHGELMSTLDAMCAAVSRAAADEELKPWERAAAPDRHKAMARERQEAKERAKRQRAAKDDEAMLGSCVRLVEHWLRAHLVEALIAAAACLRRRLEEGSAPGEPPKKLFSVSAGMEPGCSGLVLDPPVGSFGAALRRALQNAAAVADALPTLATAARGLGGQAVGTPDAAAPRQKVSDVLAGHSVWLDTNSRIQTALDASLGEALAFATGEILGPCTRTTSFRNTWDQSAYEAKRYNFKGVSQEMELAQKLRDDLSRCRCQRLVGPIFLDFRTLREGLMQIPENAIAVMKQALTSLAHDRCAAVFRRFDSVIKAVDDRPREDGFGMDQYSDTYKWAVQEQSDLEGAFDEVRSMYDLLGEVGHRVPLGHKVQLDQLAGREHDLTHRAMLEARLVLDRRPSAVAALAESEEGAAAPQVTVTVNMEDADILTGMPLLTQEE